MTGKTWLLAGVAVILLTGPGCVCCGNKSYAVAHEMGAECEVPTCQRNQVYLFAIGGMNPAEMLALESLREGLNRQGFAKVGTGQSVHVGVMVRQMREIRTHEPDAVFVILGSEAGAPAAVRLAERSQAEGSPIAALVILDAEGKTPVPDIGVRTLALGSGYGTSPATATESVNVPVTGRFALPTDARTVAIVTQLLHEVAQTTASPVVEHVMGWWYPDAPPARPVVDPGRDGNWVFLFDQPGDVPLAIGQGQPAFAAKPKPPVYTSAAR
jgi:hypothetical protein